MRITVNDRPREVPDGTTVAGLVELLGQESANVAVEVNLEIVPRARHDERELADGDTVEVVTFTGGG